jgi:transglutaminase-like putative cysteine protease
MIYSIRQVITYQYASVVPFARHALRLTPVAASGQTVLSSSIAIEPEPHERSESDDFFGNHVTQIAVEQPHRSLTIASHAEVRVDGPPAVPPEATPHWIDLRDQAAEAQDAAARAPCHYLFPSRLVPIDPVMRDYALKSFDPDDTILAAGIDLMARINADFAYDPTATDATTPVGDAFALRRGVCQDFAHIMIAGLRALGLPAAYVSGYLRTEPLPGRPRLEGADATHAWVALWCGPECGWQGLDPTNDVRVGSDHIVLAFGRDFADVSPVDGVIVASGGHTHSVAVDVVPRDDPG